MTSSNQQSEDLSQRAVAEFGSTRLAVRVNDEWCPEVFWYTADLPVFVAVDGSEIDIRDDGSILYETPGGAVQELEPQSRSDGIATYVPMSIYPADAIEVQEIDQGGR